MTSAQAETRAVTGPLSPSGQIVEREMPLVSVLVPAKDEADNLPLFMEQAAATFAASQGRYEVVVVDDGSIDDTWAVLQSLVQQYPFLRAARHRARRGIAESLRTGYLHSSGSILVFYPADLQYKPEDIPRLVAPIVARKAEIVIGDRRVGSLPNFSWLKRRLQVLGSWVLGRAAELDTPDATSGFRALSRDAALRTLVLSSYSYTLETLIQAGARRAAVMFAASLR